MTKFLPAAALVALMAFTAPAQADKVTDAMDRAAKAYRDGKLSSASRELQFAVGGLGQRLAKAYQDAMPPAPSGWKARRANTRNQGIGVMGMGMGITVSQRYRADGGQGRASAQLVMDNPMIQAMGAMFANPAMAQSSGFERLEVKGLDQPGFIKFDEDRKRGDAIILIAGRIFLKVDASGIDNVDVLRKLASGWDIKRIKEIAEIP